MQGVYLIAPGATRSNDYPLTDRMRLIFNVKPVVFEVTDMQVMTNIKGQLPHANRTVMLNPFPPKSDKLLISPYNITPESLI